MIYADSQRAARFPCTTVGEVRGFSAQKRMGQPKTIEEMISELDRAGWRKVMAAVWISPNGNLFRGPFGAWKAMMAGAK
jgi:hypothetical protein